MLKNYEKITDRINNIKGLCKKKKLDGYILSTHDEYLNEYVPREFQRLNWLTGFSGSNGLILFINSLNIFFTDGRYLVQAKKEIPKSFIIIDSSRENIFDWLERNIKKKTKLGIDPRIHSIAFIKKLIELAKDINVSIELNKNTLIDKIMHEECLSSQKKVSLIPMKFCGKKSDLKIRIIKKKMKDYDYLIITNPFSVNWLLNIRGTDIEYSPIVLCRMIIASKKKYIFIDKKKLDKKIQSYLESLHIEIFNEQDIYEIIQSFPSKSRILIDEKAAYSFYNLLINKKNLITTSSIICSLEKSKKNKVEIKNSVLTHEIDGLSVIKFMNWLENYSTPSDLNEFDVAMKLNKFREENKLYFGPSFSTISAVGKNSAIIHYSPTNIKSQKLVEGSIYLCDSGGHYLTGTTDITRTFVIGNKKFNKEYKNHYTKVLKGHIDLSMMKFPFKTKGVQLDSIARYHLWESGLDYNHGTGHGVGNFLSVHEGPQSISKSLTNINLEEGMILSIEPGFYLENKYGIRIENLVYLKKAKYKNFLEFVTLTLVPYEKKLIDITQLNYKHIEWINDYHKNIYVKFSSHLDQEQNKWLKIKTAPI